MGKTSIPAFQPHIVNLDAPWREEAACREEFLEDASFANKWDTKDRATTAFKAASEVCRTRCRVREQCLRDAVSDITATGNRAGYGFDRGTVLAEDADRIQREFGITARRRTPKKDQQPFAEAG